MGPRRIRSVVPLVVATIWLGLLAPSSASAVVPPERVLGEPGVVEFLPFANDTWVAYSQNTRTNAGRFNAYAETLDGATRRKVNAPRSVGFTGNFDPGTNTLIYQQVKNESNLWFYDLDTLSRSAVPDVNTPAWEWAPLVSTDHVLFNRDSVRNGRAVTTMWLYDRNTSTLRRIEEWGDANLYTPTGSVGDDYLTYTVCSQRTCRAFIYSIADRTTRRIPDVNDRPVYAPVVDEANGHLYFIRSGFGCGSNAGVWRLPIADLTATPTRIADLGDGSDSYSGVASLAPNASVLGSQDLYYDRLICRNFQSDIFALRDVTSVPDATVFRRGRAGASGDARIFAELPTDIQR